MGLEDYFPFLLGCGCYKNTTKNKRSISNKNISGYPFQEGVGSDDLPKSCRFAFLDTIFVSVRRDLLKVQKVKDWEDPCGCR